jgi:hypothetical protein
MYENIQTLRKLVDISDICNFFRPGILPICWSYHKNEKAGP